MKTFVIRIAGLLVAGAALCAPYAAQAEALQGKVKAKQSRHAATVAKDEDEAEPDIHLSKNFDYQCELGNSITMYTNQDDPQHMAMRWKKRLYRLTRVETTTGASRFENPKAGFVWIGIPAKGLLLDSHKGQQLANECKTAEPVLAEVNAAEAATQAK